LLLPTSAFDEFAVSYIRVLCCIKARVLERYDRFHPLPPMERGDQTRMRRHPAASTQLSNGDFHVDVDGRDGRRQHGGEDHEHSYDLLSTG